MTDVLFLISISADPVHDTMDNPSSMLILPLYTLRSICKKSLFFNKNLLDKMRREKAEQNRLNIKFLFGQILNIHGDCSAIGLQEGILRYDDTLWTKDYGILFKLYCLAQSKGLITEFSALPSDPNIISAIKASNVVPTLSPKDPDFPAWWEAHKSEWEA